MKKLVVLVGPTASGKTEIAQQLALSYPLEIISADSRQVYKFMDIGTGKMRFSFKDACCRQIKDIHHLVDIIEPDKDFTAADYKEKAEAVIEKTYKSNKIPFLVGGSGLYVRAVIDGLCPAPSADWQIRKKLESKADQHGNIYIYNKLSKVDPAAASKIHFNDRRRIIRALEVYEQTKMPFSNYQAETVIPDYTLLIMGIRYSLDELYMRINNRVDSMIKMGLAEEVERLLANGYQENLKSMESLGYKEITGYLKGRYRMEEAIQLLKRNTRRYGRRQMIWFRRDKRIKWIDAIGTDISCAIGKAGKILDNFLKMEYN
jgi:tRNA dimethylallyltransferase